MLDHLGLGLIIAAVVMGTATLLGAGLLVGYRFGLGATAPLYLSPEFADLGRREAELEERLQQCRQFCSDMAEKNQALASLLDKHQHAIPIVWTMTSYASSRTQMAASCGCTDCQCPDCDGVNCSCSNCACGDCGCRPQSVAAGAHSCCASAAKSPARAECGCEMCKCPGCNGEFCTCPDCDCVGCACAN